jgi:RNA polymerase sigma-70 factor (ECF subfamily)
MSFVQTDRVSSSSSVVSSEYAEAPIDVEDLYLEFGGMVVRRCRSILGCEDEARDAAQEVFVRLIRHRGTLTARHPSSLLYRMATNVSLNIIRSRKRRRETAGGHELLGGLAHVDERFGRVDKRSLLDRVFHSEPASTRTMAERHYVDGLTLHEVARESGLSVSGVRKRLRVLKSQPHVAAMAALSF